MLLFSFPVQRFTTPWTAACQASLSLTISPVCPSSYPLHWWCHPAISSSDTLFSCCPQSFPASGTFPVSQLFVSDDQNTGVSVSASVLPRIQGWFPLRLTGLNFLLSKGLSGVFPSTTVWRSQFFSASPSLLLSSQPYVTTGKAVALTIWTFVVRIMSLFLNTLSRFVIAFLPRNKHLISWL